MTNLSPAECLAALDELMTFASRGVESDDPARQIIEPALDAIAAVRAAFSELEARQWRPISEAPRDGSRIIVGAHGHPPERVCWVDSVWLTGWWADGDRSDAVGPDFKPTHWQPLPTPPQEPV